MAKHEDDYPDEWDQFEVDSFENITSFGNTDEDGTHARDDEYLQDLYDDAYFDPDISPDDRHDAREELDEYMWEVYGIDFQEFFDWDGWAEWYDSQ